MKEDVYEFTASPAAELKEQNRVLVTTVARAYKEAKELPVICAGSFDPAPITRSKKWTPEICHFRLQQDDAVIGKDGARLIKLAAPIFNARGLHPARYFRVIRHGSASTRRTR